MSTVVDFGLFCVGFFFGFLCFTLILLPIFHGIPRASVWAFRGWVRARAPLRYLWLGVRWFMALVGLLVFLQSYFPSVYTTLRDNPGLNWGSLVGTLFGAGFAIFHPTGRRSRQEDFVAYMQKRYLTSVGATMLAIQCKDNIILKSRTLVMESNSAYDRILATWTHNDPDVATVRSAQDSLLFDIQLGMATGLQIDDITKVIEEATKEMDVSKGARMALDHVLKSVAQ